jgi:hypothetical protein
MSRSTKLFLPAVLAALVAALAPIRALAWETGGIVTGRIYDELATNTAPFREWRDMQLGWMRMEFEEFYNLPAGTPYSSPQVQANKQKFQAVIQNARNHGIKVLGIVAYSAMPQRADFPGTAAGVQAYVDAVKWHLDNYSVDAIQIWNEPGSNVAFTNSNLKRYAVTLIEVYRQLKPLYPNVLFVGPATANAEAGAFLGNHHYGFDPENSIFNCTEMLNYRAANGGRLPLDVVSWHPYGTGGDPYGNFYFGRTFATYYNEILAYRDRAGRNVIGSYPIWFTEYGWDTNNVGDENQRIYTERMMTLIFARSQVKVPFLYSYRDDENVAGTEFKRFGIRRNSQFGYAKKRNFYPFVSKNSLVGLFTQDGVNEWTIDQIVDKYLAAGGLPYIGRAYRHPSAPWYGDKAHYWGPNNNGIIQQFNYAAAGECGILLKLGSPVAFLLKGGFYQHYVANGGPYAYGWPTSDEYVSGSYVFQNFEVGRLRWRSGESVIWIPN